VKNAEETHSEIKVDDEIQINQENTKDSLEQYSLENEAEQSWCCAFFTQFWAVMQKRLIISSRTWLTIIVEILLPILLMVFGFTITFVKFFYDGPERIFEPGLYELPQNILINSNNINGLSNYAEFTKYLDSGINSVPYTINAKTDKEILTQMDDFMYQTNDKNSPKYGSLYLKSLDKANHKYEFVILANLLSQDSSAAFMTFFSQALLRTISGNSKIQLKFANSPLPLTYQARHLEDIKNGMVIYQVLVLAVALIPTCVISFIVKEREDSLKHQQVVSGISLFAYWTSNFSFDLIKSLIVSGAGIGLIYLYPAELPTLWVLLLVFAFTIIPFTYVTSFLFRKEHIAFTLTLMFHFSMALIFCQIVNSLYIADSTRSVAKIISYILRSIPTFSLAYGIIRMSRYFFFQEYPEKVKKFMRLLIKLMFQLISILIALALIF